MYIKDGINDREYLNLFQILSFVHNCIVRLSILLLTFVNWPEWFMYQQNRMFMNLDSNCLYVYNENIIFWERYQIIVVKLSLSTTPNSLCHDNFGKFFYLICEIYFLLSFLNLTNNNVLSVFKSSEITFLREQIKYIIRI